MPAQTKLTAAELAAALRPSLLRLTRRVRNQRVDTSVSLAQLSAIGTLLKRGAMSAGELAACEQVQPPSMTKIIAGLVDKGMQDQSTRVDEQMSFPPFDFLATVIAASPPFLARFH